MALVNTPSGNMQSSGGTRQLFAGNRKSPDMPWLDYASTAMPDSHELILWWAQYLWLTNGIFRSAFERVGQHFLTEITFPELEADEESEYKDLFQKHLNYKRELKSCADDFLCFGNVFIYLYIPFRRYMRCTNKDCKLELVSDRANYKLVFEEGGLKWTRGTPCPRCGNNDPYECVDRNDSDISRIKLVRMSPFEMQIAQNPISQSKVYYWKIPQDIRRDLRSGIPIFVDETPLPFLEAVAIGGDIMFDEDAIFHLDETCVSGLRTRGWGIPRSISNFRLAWLSQLYNRADQAIALDYTLGMRIFSPNIGGAAAGADPMVNHNMSSFTGHVTNMINAHRDNPATFHTAPYPLNYQFAGGEGEGLIPPEKLKFRQQEFLTANNIPVEYHQMTLNVQAAPMALQLFESAWSSIPSLYNSILSWVVKCTARNFGLDETAVVMRKTTIAYDEARKQILTQLMAANQISPATALEGFGLSATEEVDKTFKHQEYVKKKQREADEAAANDQEMGAVTQLAGQPGPSSIVAQQQAQQQGQQGGMPGGAGGTLNGAAGMQGSNTLQGMSDQAQQIAQQLASMPDYDRKQQLRQLRESNKDLHSLVIAALEKVRSSAASQGKQQILQGQQPR